MKRAGPHIFRVWARHVLIGAAFGVGGLVVSSGMPAQVLAGTAQAGPASAPAAASATQPGAPLPADVAKLGRLIFFDTSLSASGKLACASCHDPAHAYAPPNALAVQLGGAGLNVPGLRTVPSLRYTLARTPRWGKEFQSDALERMVSTDSVPVGGFARDGRFDTLHEQAASPLLAANEMANASPDAVVAKLARAPYAAQFERSFGAGILQQPAQAYAKALEALERFELDDPSFHPYSSKFDRHLQGKAKLNAAETRGMLLFADPNKANCAACHTLSPGADGSPPLFTDFSFAALGVPRNRRLAVNADPRFYDLGLCGPLRSDQAGETGYCGMFKTPTLRNVAARKVFMHNGVFTDLTTAVRFYAQRDTHAQKWYPRQRNGEIERYDDLPPALRDNIDVVDAPLNRKLGEKPALNEAEIRDITAFLRTLTDADVRK